MTCARLTGTCHSKSHWINHLLNDYKCLQKGLKLIHFDSYGQFTHVLNHLQHFLTWK